MNNSLKLPDDFDVNQYRLLNNDLKYLNHIQLKDHYINNGINECRKYKIELPEDFDVKSYRFLNDDLKNMNDEELVNHYINFGINEGRNYKIGLEKKKNINVLPDDFNSYIYINNYDDLFNLNENEIKIHYVNHGIYEKRIYNILINPNKFDWRFYLDINNINNINNENDAIEHCLKYYGNLNIFYNSNILIFKNINIKKIMEESNKFKTRLELYQTIINNYSINYINNLDLCNINININFNYKSNIIISLAILPNRILINEFENCLIFLLNQKITPKYIIINYCTEYKRIKNINYELFYNKISYFKNKYNDSIIFNESFDYGPITKALGLLHLNDNIKSKIDNNDKIIIIDDDWKYNNLLTYYYELCYNLYNCDGIFIDEKNLINWNNNMEIISKKNIFYDNYSGFAYGWLSFSFKYKYLSNLNDIYNELLKIDNNIFLHDDLTFTIFYKKFNLYICGINLFLPINDIRLLEYSDGLRLDDNSYNMRFNLEQKFLKIYNILFEVNNSIKIIKNKEYNNNFIIDNLINERNLLYEINEIEYDPKINNYEKYHFDIKYISSNIFLLTITNFSDKYEDIIFNFKYNNINKILKIDKYKYSNKISFFIKTNFYITYLNHKVREEKIIQTYENNNISRNKFYSICTILNKLPHFKYIFFNNENRIDFINKYYPNIISLYEKVNVGAYKADLFRVLYLYKFGGLYFDCKNILFSNLKEILNENEAYARDYNAGVCNGFIYTKYPNNEIIKKYLLEMLYNFYKNKYFKNNEYGALEICGPQCFSKFIINNYNIKLHCYFENDNWKESLFIDSNKNILIKISYYDYYNENNYVNTSHYSVMWSNRTVYNNIILNYNKINHIDGIAWINLDRSKNRRNNMENILKNIDIPNYRISAIDGKNEDVKNIINGINVVRNMNDYEIACSLSHIKAISFLSELDGNYFMVFEDDIELRNINIINDELKNIINKCPEFDILILHKIYINRLNEEYVNWNNNINKLGEDYQIGGTASYIITRSGINKINNICNFTDINNFNFNKCYKFDVADMFLFKNTTTYVYKYNYISILGIDSNIHNDHIMHHNKCEEIQDKYILENSI
jgi:mannosyltransferase OCH1-like enzyme